MCLPFARSLRLLLLGCASAYTLARAQSDPDYERPPVNYSASSPHDAVTALQQRIESGALALPRNELAALRTLLDALHVPVESQVVVFSKTSLQRARIRPDRPRALYFSDSVYVGWVPGGLAEITAIDPLLGPVFYSVHLPDGLKAAPKIERNADCLRCHGGTFIRDIPGLFARSIFADAEGEPMLRYGTQLVDDETPFAERWGGWYVTGFHGTENHRGNVIGAERNDQLVFTPSAKRPDDLREFFDTSAYLAPTSDVVALLVLEHQMAMQNSLTRANQSCRKIIVYQHGLQETFKEPVTDEPAFDSVKSVFNSAVQDVVDHLLFRHAAPLPEGIVGHAAFRQRFAQDTPRTRAGAALKDLQLRDRLFAVRCSYMIYSESFRALPETLKARILDQLGAALRSRDPKDRYAYLDHDEKQRIYDILLETHPDARARWQAVIGDL